MSKPLTGKIAVVTGASRGIGRAIAEKLADDGATVAVHYGRSAEAANAVVKSIRDKGGDAFAVGADLKERKVAEKLFKQVDAELAKRGRKSFDILVNNAGVASFVSFADTKEETIDEIYAVNVRALFMIAQASVPRLNDGGRIINTSSIVARAPFAAVPAYSMLKAPVDNLTKTLAVELGPRAITVNAIAPGAIETDMAEFVRTDDGAAMVKSKQALKRVGTVNDVADVAAFLAGPQSRWVTGEVIEVGGGSALTL
jgi:Dehydrogenases with different specificities (related to short-chain alcohol dehydrogenases)